MKKTIYGITILLVMLLFMNHHSFAQFVLTGEIRPRVELRNGYKTLPDTVFNYAAFVSQRSRIAMQYKAEKISMKISFQDVRIWGDELLKTDIANIGLHEAWAEMQLCDSLSLKIGKQELAYDNERLLSASNWTQLGAAHNAVILRYKRAGWQVDFAAGFNQSKENLFGTDYSSILEPYKTLNILWISKKLSDDFKISALGIADGYQKAGTKNTTYIRGTFGGIADYVKEKKYSAALRGFYQTGKLQTGQEVAAYYANADFSYTIAEKYTFLLGFEYFSGNDEKDTANRKSNSFSTLYGSGHKFNGNMDYFTNIPKDTKGAGLINPYLDFIYAMNEKVSLRADFHYFRLQNNYLINNDVLDKYLGLEADLSCKYNFMKDASLLFGFSLMRGEKSLEPIVGGNSSYYGTWGFAMLTFKPTFFKSEKK